MERDRRYQRERLGHGSILRKYLREVVLKFFNPSCRSHPHPPAAFSATLFAAIEIVVKVLLTVAVGLVSKAFAVLSIEVGVKSVLTVAVGFLSEALAVTSIELVVKVVAAGDRKTRAT